MRIEIIAVLLSPVIAVLIGEWLRNRNYNKEKREDLIRRILKYGYQLSSAYTKGREEMLGALNEIKYWYFKYPDIKDLTFNVMNKMGEGETVQEDFISLIQKIAKKENHDLSREDIEKVFSER